MSSAAADTTATDLAPRPERWWIQSLFAGLDAGRSRAMRKFVEENGLPAAVYAVCVQFWILATFCVALLAVVTLLVGAHHPGIHVLSVFLWVIFALTLLTAAARYRAVLRLRKEHRAAESKP